MLEDYGYKEKEYRRTETVVKAIEEIESLKDKINVAKNALILAKEFYQYLQMKSYPIAITDDFRDDYEKITRALEKINE